MSSATRVLALTSFAAGVIDVLSFARLGGVFTSAMTGNLALLGLHAAIGDLSSAVKSLIALAGFIVGCAVGMIYSRRRADRSAVRRLLGFEFLIVLVCAVGIAQGFVSLQMALLAVAMGLQGVVGARLGQTNVVFTTTLIKIVSALTRSSREADGASGWRCGATVVGAYLIGALVAGFTIAVHFLVALLIPLAAIGTAFICANGVAREGST